MSMRLPGPFGEPLGQARLKRQAEDFRVREILGFEAAGQGEHLLIRVEKTGLTTPMLIEELARSLEVHPRTIGHAGLKDRQAVTEQWLSVQMPGRRRMPSFPQADDWRVLETHWHDRKLRRGAHRGNAFIVVLREVEADRDLLEQRLRRIRQSGFANYFGEQRFGRGGDNVQQALKALGSARSRKRLGRNRRSLYISALRSELFNRVLARRIEQGIWEQPLQGDVWMLEGSGSWFREAINDELLERYRSGDLHSGLGLHGSGDNPLRGEAAALEAGVLSQAGEMTELLQRLEVRRGLRPHRALARDLACQWRDEQTLELRVTLGRGVYFTSLIEQVLHCD